MKLKCVIVMTLMAVGYTTFVHASDDAISTHPSLAKSSLGEMTGRDYSVKQPAIIAHRGASRDAPENTLAAFALGFRQGADGIELDVHRTKDGTIIASHDADTKRCAGVARKIADQTFDQLQKLDVGRWKGEPFTSLRIPALEEVLSLLPTDKQLLIEIKCGPDVVAPLRDCLQKSRVADQQILLQAFDFETVCLAKKAMPTVRSHWLLGDTDLDLESLVDPVLSAGLNGLNPDWKCQITPGFVERAHRSNLEIYVWTVNHPDIATRLSEIGVAGLITDCPAAIRTHLDVTASPSSASVGLI